MELSSQDAILEWIGEEGNATRRQRRQGARTARVDRRVRCTCGVCSQCLDDARWNRIFTEKFADPNYYAHRVPRIVSPLTSL